MFSYTIDAVGSDDARIRGELVGADRLVFTRAGNAAAVTLTWQVVSWSGWSIRRGTASLAANTFSTSAAIVPPVDPAHAFPIITGSTNGAVVDEDDLVLAELAAPGVLSLQVLNDSGNPSTFAWQVVEIPSATIQRGRVPLPDGAPAAPLAILPFDPARSWLVYSHASGGISSQTAATMVRGRIVDGASIAFDRAANLGDHQVAWYLIELAAARVQRGSQAFADGERTQTLTIDAVDPARTFTYGGGFGGMSGRSAHAVDGNPGPAWARAALSGTGSLQLERGLASQAADLPWSVIELP